MPARIGLALSGGGAKGAFTVGALKVIRQKMPGSNPTFPVISGTSTGSFVGTLLAINDFTALVEIYSKVQTKNIVNPHHALVASLLGPEAVLFAAAVRLGRACRRLTGRWSLPSREGCFRPDGSWRRTAHRDTGSRPSVPQAGKDLNLRPLGYENSFAISSDGKNP
jgi:predicted acylesterase/phospholipase RssA